MGVTWSSYKEKRKEKKELKGKRGLRSSMSVSERKKGIREKVQLEQALEKQINLEKFALTASNRPQQMDMTLSLSSSPAINKMVQRRDTSDLQSSVSESDRLMDEACQFAQFTKKHPLEKWTVGSLPDLSLYW